MTTKPAATLTAEWPMTLPSASNLHEQWWARHKRVKAQRATTGLALRANGVAWRLRQLVPGERLAVRLVRVSPRELDDDNLQGAFKAVRDEIAAFFGIDDRDARIRWLYGQTKGKPSAVRVDFVVESRKDPRSRAEANGAAARKTIEAEVARLAEGT